MTPPEKTNKEEKTKRTPRYNKIAINYPNIPETTTTTHRNKEDKQKTPNTKKAKGPHTSDFGPNGRNFIQFKSNLVSEDSLDPRPHWAGCNTRNSGLISPKLQKRKFFLPSGGRGKQVRGIHGVRKQRCAAIVPKGSTS